MFRFNCFKLSATSIKTMKNQERHVVPLRINPTFLRQKLPYGIAAAVLVLILSLTSCTSPASGTISPNSSPALSGSQNNLAVIQEYGNLSARFYGLMTFKSSGTEVSFPSEFSVPPVSINWMGGVFNGKLEETGAGEDVTYEVHGGMSADGNWVDSVYFSRQILRKSANNSGSFFRVTLRSVPMVSTVNGAASQLGSFEKTGADVQKYISKIEYADGPMNGNQIASNTDYVSTDWKNTNSARMPVLKLVLGKGPGEQKQGAPAGNTGMMGQ
jgi:hypothetical protein